jgi:8-hydroxy-5-deazaflavin:NADPH oxidoreductase
MQAEDLKTIGIIGAGRIGQVMTRIAQRAGRPVVIANNHGPESLATLVGELGAGVTAGTVEEAASAPIVVIAVNWADVPKAVAQLPWEGRIVIDPTNNFDPGNMNGRTSSEIVAELVAPARVVKAGNTYGADVLGADPHRAGGQLVIFLSGDDAEAKSEVGGIFTDAGYSLIDLGGLQEGGRMQQVGGPLAGKNLIRLP